MEMFETTCLLPQQRSKHFRNGTTPVPIGGESLLLSLLSYYLALTILHMAYGCHECPRKPWTMLISLRH
jgi:hypothetical protein